MDVNKLAGMYISVCNARDKHYAFIEGYRQAETDALKLLTGSRKSELDDPEKSRFKQEADRLYQEYLNAVAELEKK